MAKLSYLDREGLARLAEDLEFRHPSTFTGTREEWASLPEERKNLIKIVNFIDDLNQEDNRHPNIFIGTRTEWNALLNDEKSKYLLVCLTDDLSGDGWILSNVVEDGNMNPVTSNAVFHAIEDFNNIFVVSDIKLTFTGTTGEDPYNYKAEYIDDRVSPFTCATIFYRNSSLAKVAKVDAETASGKIIFRAVAAPTDDIFCTIICK